MKKTHIRYIKKTDLVKENDKKRQLWNEVNMIIKIKDSKKLNISKKRDKRR